MTEQELEAAYKAVVIATNGDLKTGVGCCPAHADQSPSFRVSIVDGKLLVHCHAGCGQAKVISALTELGVWPYADGLTLAQYAEAKQLPVNALVQFGLSDFPNYPTKPGKPVVRITYHDENGGEAARRYRTRLHKSGDGGCFHWKKDAKVCLYGLERLKDARVYGHVTLVEGESDCHTLWCHDEPALGVPGANTWKEPWASKLGGIPIIYLVDEGDQGGQALLNKIAKSSIRDRVKVIRLGEYKDPSSLYLNDPDNFADRWDEYKDAAVPLADALPSAPLSDGRPQTVTVPFSLVNLDEIEEEEIEWLWEGRIPYGKVSLLDGEPGLGKSTLTIHIASCLSKGKPILGNTYIKAYEPIPTLFVTAEDDLADTVRPRVRAAGGNARLIWTVPLIPDGALPNGMLLNRLLTLPDDLGILEQQILEKDIRFVVIDPLMAFFNNQIDAHKDQDVRRALYALSEMAKRTSAAILIVRHLNKSVGASAINRGGGSIAIIGAARSAMVMAKDPEDEEKRVLAQIKSNVAKPVPSLRFRLQSEGDDKAAHIVWEGISVHNADELVNPVRPKISVTDAAKEFIKKELADGPRPSSELEEMSTAQGISRASYDRARNALGVVSEKKGEKWYVSLPASE